MPFSSKISSKISLHWYNCFSNLLHLLNQGKCHHRRNPAIHLAWKHYVFRLDVSTDSLNNSPMILLYLSRTQCRWNIAIIYPILSHVPFYYTRVHKSQVSLVDFWVTFWRYFPNVLGKKWKAKEKLFWSDGVMIMMKMTVTVLMKMMEMMMMTMLMAWERESAKSEGKNAFIICKSILLWTFAVLYFSGLWNI